MKPVNIICLIAFFLNACTSENGESVHNYVILGKTSDSLNHKTAVLSFQENKQFTPMDTAILQNGNFTFSGRLDRPVVANVRIENTKNSLSFFMEKDSVFLNINSEDLSKSTVEGSELHSAYLDFIAQNNKILGKMKLYYPLLQKARSENDPEKLRTVHQKIAAVQKEKNNFVLNYAKNHPNSYIGAFALYTLLGEKSIPMDTISDVLSSFSVPVRKSDFAIQTLIYLDNEKIEQLK